MYSKRRKTQAKTGSKSPRLLILCALLSSAPFALAQEPAIQPIPDQMTATGTTFRFTPTLENPVKAGPVNWSKAYGHDDIKIDPQTGTVTWNIPKNQPGESFHLGLQSTNQHGSTIESFIIHAGVAQVVHIGPGETAKNFEQAFSSWKSPGNRLRTPGTTFVVRNGDYSGSKWSIGLTEQGAVQHPPAGTEKNYTTVMAEDPGQVRLHSGGSIYAKGNFDNVAYWAIKGFFIDGGHLTLNGADCEREDRGCKPHHVKFIRNGVNLKHGTSSLGASFSHHILFENNYAYGGQRTKFLAYKSSQTIFRRNVARFDHNEEHYGPKNTFSFYTSIDVLAQNNIAIDADQQAFIDGGEQAGEFGCPTTAGPSKARWDRNIQLNSDMLHGNLDKIGGSCFAVIKNVIGWDNRSPHSFVRTRSPSLFDHATFGAIQPEDKTHVTFNGWPAHYARGITNSILHNIQGPVFEGLMTGETKGIEDEPLQRYGVDTVNITNIDGPLIRKHTQINEPTITDFDPLWSKGNPKGGLRYLVRIEPNSNLSGKGADGQDLGATVMTFKGKSGSLWGEQGYDQETDLASWPFPMQVEIANKMRSMSHTGPTWKGTWLDRTPGPTATLSGDRGFAKASTDLTRYIWGYLGSTVPPFNVFAFSVKEQNTDLSKTASQVRIQWDANTDPSVTEYRVYEYDPETRSISNPQSVGLNNHFTFTPKSKKNNHFAVTAVSSSTGESSWSYPAALNNAGDRIAEP